ncbi:efflux RND transporter periplasmic adaptor subunit [Methylobacterium nonmethylotrophicum]|uniref:Efflux RND transporter periplasmic adaptor subunit n=1 Tax=Methylobacterium nonmethylotrophicum TaxID=1141884 RepID=A0A4Z0NDV5_9HYPH|nr:efflux RND transporter periplasmic adaptor subunit [Methylobacterium nonmethylotrophicum]TGD93870.1 efflux RND transporter periplasmic adaptor subunit [Methylobacterium nonmethylotrophicum]
MPRTLRLRSQVVILAVAVAGAVFAYPYLRPGPRQQPIVAFADVPVRQARAFTLTPSQLATVSSEPVVKRQFFEEIATEGKIGVDEYQATPVFSPYPGRVIAIFARAGEQVKRGQPLFSVQANEMVQAQNDYLAALNVLNKSRSQLAFAQAAEKRQRDLFETRATTLRELQVAQNDLTSATNDNRTAEVGLEAVRNRLRILGLRDEDMAALQRGSAINPNTPINAPLDGTIIQRKIGPGQYVGTGGEPSYLIGDLSKVWLVAQLREADAAKAEIGEKLLFRVPAHPERTFEGRINYIGTSVDPATRRITVRAEIDNRQGLLKPEMYASVRIINERENLSHAVPRAAVILEGNKASVWVIKPDNSVENRPVRPGIVDGGTVEILDGLKEGERVISRGSLFIDRMSTQS